MSEDVDALNALSRRARRAMPLIAGALTAIVVTGLIYLHPSIPQRPLALPTPSPSPSVLSTRFQAVYDFVTPSFGWALVSDPPPNGARFYVFKTTDGARRWVKQFSASSPDTGVLNIQFFDPTHGLISLGNPIEIYRTSDAGAHWEPLQLPRYLVTSMTFSDPSHGWVAETDPDSGFTRHLFATNNGGLTWTELLWPPWATAIAKGAVEGDLQFRRPSDGWLGAAADAPTVYTTIDGGVSWQPHVLPSLPKPAPDSGGKPLPLGGGGFGFFTSVSLLPGTGVIAFVDDYAQSAAYTSFDGGSTWRLIAPPPGETAYSQFVYQDAFHWWAMRFGALWKSTDAGQTWKQVGQQLDAWDYRPHIIDARHAWAELFASVTAPRQILPTAGLAMTSDGGLHWTQVNTPQAG
jgi:photosystem II stability/assembly factor-like uncharacterized protein